MKKTIFAFGFDLPPIEGFETISYSSDRSMLDADIIAAELTLVYFRLSGEFYRGSPIIAENESHKYKKSKESWHKQLSTALSVGKTIVFFLTERVERQFYTGERKNVGTAGRPIFNTIVSSCSNYDYLPVPLKNPQYVSGNSMVLDSSADIISDYWQKFSKHSRYNCFFEEGGQPLVRTKSGGHITGSHWKERGNLVLLPEIYWSHLPNIVDNGFDREWSEAHITFTRNLRDALIGIDFKLKKDKERTKAPDWASSSQFKLKIELILGEEFQKISSEIEQLSARQREIEKLLEEHGFLRQLLYDGGFNLEFSVRAALMILGFNVDHFKDENSEFDALFTSAEGRFLGEVEGKESKPINVDKISQVHRNISEDFKRDSVTEIATAVLFGNAFKNTPLEKRDDFFTEKVVKFAATAKIALVKTPDLFFVAKYIYDSSDMEFALACRLAIKDGAGGIVKFPPISNDSTAADHIQAQNPGTLL